MWNPQLFILPLSVAYFGFVLSLVMRDLQRESNAWCVYVTAGMTQKPDLPSEPAEPQRADLIYVVTNATRFVYAVPPEYQVLRCTVGFYEEADLPTLGKGSAEKVRLVRTVTDCKFYLWFSHVRLSLLTMTVYFAYLCVRYSRLMFGVCGPSTDPIPPGHHPFNYIIFLFSSVVMRVPYKKLNRLFRELAFYRGQALTHYRRDPLSYMYWNYHAAIGLVVEFALHVACYVLVVSSLTAYFSPCRSVLPLTFKIFCGLFVGLFLFIESGRLLASIRNDLVRSGRETATAGLGRGGPQDSADVPFGPLVIKSGLLAPCCVNILANLAIKAIYVGLLVGFLIFVFYYERKIQDALFN
ncbi:F-gK [Chelonid alphaherpesvirus 5]|uniref:Envelope glycoprotein K n=1 Tax=Chelonid alphaherpesvirus 5 TaxID=702736 RepID=V5NXG6_9ALPH|nr:F-gK [Chelonid alphaherpesvirus 5]AHA93374.1 F-gK [Chelonid alphaherpesvirus 5]